MRIPTSNSIAILASRSQSAAEVRAKLAAEGGGAAASFADGAAQRSSVRRNHTNGRSARLDPHFCPRRGDGFLLRTLCSVKKTGIDDGPARKRLERRIGA